MSTHKQTSIRRSARDIGSSVRATFATFEVEAARLPGTIPISRAYWGAAEAEHSDCNLRDAVEALAYALLEETHGGWENNEGAYGEFTFAVAARTITLDYNERHMESDYSQHVF